MFPVPIYCIKRKIDYRLLLSLIEISNFNIKEKEGGRYLYYNMIDKNRDRILKCLKIEKSNFNKKIKILIKENILEQHPNQKEVFRLNLKSEDDKEYVLIEKDILKKLIQNHSNSDIKVYLAIRCKAGKSKQIAISRKEIKDISGIGLRTISDSINKLETSKIINIKANNKGYKKNNIKEINIK